MGTEVLITKGSPLGGQFSPTCSPVTNSFTLRDLFARASISGNFLVAELGPYPTLTKRLFRIRPRKCSFPRTHSNLDNSLTVLAMRCRFTSNLATSFFERSLSCRRSRISIHRSKRETVMRLFRTPSDSRAADSRIEREEKTGRVPLGRTRSAIHVVGHGSDPRRRYIECAGRGEQRSPVL